MRMDAAEWDIYYFVKAQAGRFLSPREIGRRIGTKRKFHHDPDWVKPILLRMAERGILESNEDGCYRLKPMPKQDIWGKSWASPEIADLLQKKGKGFGRLLMVEDEDKYYDNL
jgi:hypothetical protein